MITATKTHLICVVHAHICLRLSGRCTPSAISLSLLLVSVLISNFRQLAYLEAFALFNLIAMGFFLKGFLFVSIAIVAILFKVYYDISTPLTLPKLDKNFYWGPGSGSNYTENKAVKKFEINVPSKVKFTIF